MKTKSIALLMAGAFAVVFLAFVFRPITVALSELVYLPVASKIEWVEFTPDGGKGSRGWQVVEWKITKLKDCDYRGMNWQFRRPDGALSDLDWTEVEHRPGRDPNRATGAHTGILTRVGSTAPVHYWRVTVRHSCSPLLPDVTTQIWP